MSPAEQEMAEALHAICTTRAKQELAVYVLLRELVGDCFDKKIAISGPSKKVFAYLGPAGTRKRPPLTPERVAELYSSANASPARVKKGPLE